MLVMVGPGATAFTRMPLGPYMKAVDFVSPTTACFDAVYATPADDPRSAASDAVFTIDRTALAVAVFEENVTDLEEYTAPDERTIDDLLDRVVAQAVVSTAFIDLINAHRDDAAVAHLGGRFREVVVRLVARERAAGHIGDHVEVDDVTMATGMLATELARAAPPDRAEVADRARRLFRAAFSPR